MISLFSGKYTRKDFESLAYIIDTAIDNLMEACSQGDLPPGLICDKCDHKNTCDDLLRFQRYLTKSLMGE